MYVIISLGHLTGLINGAFHDHAWYLESSKDKIQSFTHDMRKAMSFDTEDEAWQLLNELYKSQCEHFGVISVKQKYVDHWDINQYDEDTSYVRWHEEKFGRPHTNRKRESNE